MTAPRRAYRELFADAYRGRRVLVTGHSGFVGRWLTTWLSLAGAEVTGLSLPSPLRPSGRSELSEVATEIVGDVRDAATVSGVVRRCDPEIVFHLAAQAFVLPSYEDPVATFATNVMGTVHVLDAVRRSPSVVACVAVTSDKCYATSAAAHREGDPLGGDDPYSASKAAAELVAHAYDALSAGPAPRLVTARAGNILGGGDWSTGRILPDTVRALHERSPLTLRRPHAVRPWQHVLDAVAGYLLLGLPGASATGAWNFGPRPEDRGTVGEVVALAESSWVALGGAPLEAVELPPGPVPQERTTLTLDSSRARDLLGWRPLLDLAEAVDWSVAWYRDAMRRAGRTRFGAADLGLAETRGQLEEYLGRDGALCAAHAASVDAAP